MDFQRAFTFFTKDDEWLSKLGLLALFSFLGSILFFPIFLVMGYGVDIARNVRKGIEPEMPAWDDFGKVFIDGIYMFLARLVYSLPALLLVCVAIGGVIASGAAAETFESDELAAAAILSTFGIVFCLGMLLAVVYMFIGPAVIIQYIRTNEFSACFRFREVFGIARTHISEIFMMVAVLFGLGFVFSIVTGVLGAIPCVGIIAVVILAAFYMPVMTAVSSHLIGQIARMEGKVV